MFRLGLSQEKYSLKNENKIFFGKIGITVLLLILYALVATSVSAEEYYVLNPGSSGDSNVMSSQSGNLDNIMNTLPEEDQNGNVINPSSDNLGNIMNTLPAKDQNGSAINSIITVDVNTTNLTVNLNDTLLISLKENPTTGYSWNFTNSTGLEIVSDEYVMDTNPKGMDGVGGVHKWTVNAVETGNQTFYAVMMDVADKPTDEEARYTLNVSVKEITQKANNESVETTSLENPIGNYSVI